MTLECHIRRDDDNSEAEPSSQTLEDSLSDLDIRLQLQYEDKSKTTLVMRKVTEGFLVRLYIDHVILCQTVH